MATSVGTAWIQIKPTTKSLRTAVESGLNGSQIGGTFWKSFSAAGAGAIAGITSQLTKKLTSVVSSTFSGAMERADVLTRFPKVMEQMGHSAEEAKETIKQLREGVMGLPTALTSVTTYTQRMVNTAGGLQNAADWSLAISDAMLASGANAENAERAMEQFVQAIQRGKPIGNDWLTVMEVASPTMNALAKSMGYASAEIGGEFYTAWQKGKISTEDVMNALVKLDKEGGQGLESFNKLARTAVGGFKTSMTVLRQSVENLEAGWLMGDMEMVETSLNSIVNILPNLISQLLPAFLNSIATLAKAIPQVLPTIADTLLSAENIGTLLDIIAEVIVQIAEKLPTLFEVLISKLPMIVDKIGKALGKLFESEAFWKTAALIGLAFGGKLILGKVLGWISGIFKRSVGNSLGDALHGTVTSVFKTLGDSVKNLITPLAKTLRTVFKELGNGLKEFFTALANPEVLLGMGVFAAGLLAIGAACMAVGPGLKSFMDDIVIPLATFLRDTVLMLLDHLTEAIVRLTTGAIIPLGEFIGNFLLAYIQQMTDSIIYVTQYAIIPLLNVLSGTFTQVINSIANLIMGTLYVALEGIRSIVDAIGDSFLKMGEAIKLALEGVQGILQVFADIILGISESLVAVVALATHQSVSYGRGFAFVNAAATGGLVGGIGTDTSDSNLFALSKGEYVIRAASARRIGYDNLDSLNETGTMAGGGTVNNFTINGYNKSPEELANIISRKIALNTQGVLA